MGVILLASPILPGKQEAWRRFCQEMVGTRRNQYIKARRRLGIVGERTWLLQTTQIDIAVVCIEAEQPAQLFSLLIASDLPFDRWFKRQIRELHGLDLSLPLHEPFNQCIYEWSDRRQNMTIEEDL